MDPLDVSANDLVDHFRSRTISPVEFVQLCLARIESYNPHLRAFCFVDWEGALKAARISEQRWLKGCPIGPLDGVPTSVKDLISVAGSPFRRGSRATSTSLEGVIDAPAVARLKEAGAVILGKTSTSEFGHKAVTDSSLVGITRNPWRRDLTPGGSSGGAAAAAATGMGILHLATDGGGSIRIPAGFTGVFGFKPTANKVPMFPVSPFGHLAVHGPITRRVNDSRLMMDIISLSDTRDWAAFPQSTSGRRDRLSLDGLRVGYLETLDGVEVDSAVKCVIDGAVRSLISNGVDLSGIELFFSDAPCVFDTIWTSVAHFIVENFSPGEHELLEESFIEIANRGKNVSGAAYVSALMKCAEMADQLRVLFESFDLLILPTLPITAFEAGKEHPWNVGSRGWPEWAPFCYPFNLTRSPSASVPCGLTPEGLPVGLQIVGPVHHDDIVLATADLFEKHLGILTPSLDWLTKPIERSG